MGDDPENALEALAEQAAGGDRVAFDRLARRIYPRLTRWALAKTGRPDDADEVVQRALVRIHRSLSTFRGESRLTTWAYQIAANAWLDMERSRTRRARREEPLMETIEAATASDALAPDERLVQREAAELVLSFFSTLPPRQREVIELVDMQGLDHLPLAWRQREVIELVDMQGLEPAEAATIMDVSASTARVHLHRARRSLREAIRAGHPDIAEEYGG